MADKRERPKRTLMAAHRRQQTSMEEMARRTLEMAREVQARVPGGMGLVEKAPAAEGEDTPAGAVATGESPSAGARGAKSGEASGSSAAAASVGDEGSLVLTVLLSAEEAELLAAVLRDRVTSDELLTRGVRAAASAAGVLREAVLEYRWSAAPRAGADRPSGGRSYKVPFIARGKALDRLRAARVARLTRGRVRGDSFSALIREAFVGYWRKRVSVADSSASASEAVAPATGPVNVG